MTLQYRIHWIDDSPDWVKPVRQEIEDHLEELSLAPEITFADQGDDIGTIIKIENIDLLIIDHKLPNKNGDEIIKIVREYGELTEIIFYSEDGPPQTTQSVWSGVRCISRGDASGEIKNAIAGFYSRSQNIALMRGVIIAEAIDVENKLTEIIRKLFDNKADLFQAKVLDKAILDFEKKRMLVKSCLKDRLGEEKRKNPQDSSKISELEKFGEGLEDLKKEIIDQRNILAHSEKSIDNEGRLTLKGLNFTGKIIFNNVWINKVRNNIRKHRAYLQDLSDLI